MPKIKSKKIMEEAQKLKPSFAGKIKTIEQIKKIIGKRPRKKVVVMCHGTFDIVHPGHIRQLIYAKSKGDILIVSVNSDKYATSGPFAPYVPQELRALNVAAFEIVDFVFLNVNPTPVLSISFLQPNFYIKGFEYSLKKSHPETKQEIEALSLYGGEIVFSPGDVVYSSTKLLSKTKPNISLEQLLTLMSAEGITFDNLKGAIKKFKTLKIHVIGDLIVDKYSQCTLLGPAQKSPAFSVRLDSTETYVGGAGIVAKHFKALGAKVIFSTVLGNDNEAKFAQNDLKKNGILVNALVDKTKPTTIKHRFYTTDNRLLLQVDTVDNRAISEGLTENMCRKIKNTSADAVVCSDFRHGIFNSETISHITKAIPRKSLKVADSQVSNRWGNILDFVDFDLITPNEREARFALGDQDTTIRPLAQILYNKAGCGYLILKLGENGIMVYRSPGMETREFFYVDTFVDDLVDPIGAGDALLAATTSALIVSKNIVLAAILGNLSAACECSIMGNVPISSKDLLEKIDEQMRKS